MGLNKRVFFNFVTFFTFFLMFSSKLFRTFFFTSVRSLIVSAIQSRNRHIRTDGNNHASRQRGEAEIKYNSRVSAIARDQKHGFTLRQTRTNVCNWRLFQTAFTVAKQKDERHCCHSPPAPEEQCHCDYRLYAVSQNRFTDNWNV